MTPARRSLGTRHVCSNCSTKFYDFDRPKASCPRCGTELHAGTTADPRKAAMELMKSRSSTAVAAPSRAPLLDPDEDPDTIDEEDGFGGFGDITDESPGEDYGAL